MANCFRPLTGILFFNIMMREIYLGGSEFPSPYGDFVFLFDSWKSNRLLFAGFKFPSPYGDFVF